jgi:CRP/FNR family cyclic AMP-dependent transcriptional regulator
LTDPQRLARVALFAELSDDELTDIAVSTREVAVAEGERIATQGDNAYEFFVVEEGEADVLRDGEVIAWVGPGDVMGEIGLLVTGTRTASIVARTPMTLMAMFSREFKQVERRTPAVAERLRAIMRDRVARTGYQSRAPESR